MLAHGVGERGTVDCIDTASFTVATEIVLALPPQTE